MAYLEPLEPQALAALQPLFDDVEAMMGFVPNSLKTMARNKPLFDGFMRLIEPLMGRSARLDPGLRALISHVASRAAGCRYCMAHTAHTADRAGIEADKLDAVWDYERSPLFSNAERAALRVAQGAAAVPNMVSDEDMQALKAHFNDDEIIEIIGVIAVFGFLNRWNDTLATTLEDEPLGFAQRHLAKAGWSAGKHG
ncbi:MAG: carboxymuconolactone decarboxylase family protein [Alphaproteobacteria bacterium]|nr:MAG: carboxymuconolactone decarboxylase family protein [Alphaproteobacteria bacterium]